MTLIEAENLFITAYTGIKNRELQCYRYTLNSLTAYTGNCDITAITINTLRAWRATLSGQTTLWAGHPYHPPVERKLSPFTIRGHVTRCKRFFQWLVDEELLDKNPAKRLERPKPVYDPQDITDDDINRMIEIARGNLRDWCILMVLLESGCRVGGLVNITIKNLDCNTCQAWTIEKGGKGRFVYFSPATAGELKKLIQGRQDSAEAVFWGKRGPLTTGGVYQVLKRLAKKAGVKRYNPHAFRHACARRMIAHEASMEDVSAVLGHSSSEVTRQFYAPWRNQEIKRRHQRFAWVDSPKEMIPV